MSKYCMICGVKGDFHSGRCVKCSLVKLTRPEPSGVVLSFLKYKLAKHLMNRLMDDVKVEVDEEYRKRWAFLQGQIISKGTSPWDWNKIWQK